MISWPIVIKLNDSLSTEHVTLSRLASNGTNEWQTNFSSFLLKITQVKDKYMQCEISVSSAILWYTTHCECHWKWELRQQQCWQVAAMTAAYSMLYKRLSCGNSSGTNEQQRYLLSNIDDFWGALLDSEADWCAVNHRLNPYFPVAIACWDLRADNNSIRIEVV